MRTIIIIACLLAVVSATVYFEEDFGAGWEKRWVKSTSKSDAGEWVLSAGKYFNDAEADKGLKTSQDARFYAMSAAFPKFSNKDQTLVIQFRVKHEQNIDCGGGYVKVFPSSLNQGGMNGDSPYNIMFGPDICGPGTRKVHVIFSYKGQNLLTKKSIACKADEASHLYTLIVNPDNTYEVRIDNSKVESGSLFDDFDFLLPQKINDPALSKPSDWVDEKQMADPEDTKPADWDKPQFIADPAATKPEDWDDEMDGEWEASQIENPEYKGEWKARAIANPAYKGEWVHPQIDNPDFVDDKLVYSYEDSGVIGLDLWQVKAGSIFDNVLITDDVSVAEDRAAAFKTLADGEEKAKKAGEDAERAQRETEDKAKAAAAPADDEVDDEDEGEEVIAKDEL